MMINNDYLVWFSARWMRRNMCALCRILHNPIVFRNLLWWRNMPSLSIGSESTRVYVHKATDGWIFLRSYLDFPMCVQVPMIVSMILQSSRWRIFRVGIPHTMWRICCSQYAHNFVMQMGTPHMRNFQPSSPYAYGESLYAYGDQFLTDQQSFLESRWKPSPPDKMAVKICLVWLLWERFAVVILVPINDYLSNWNK